MKAAVIDASVAIKWVVSETFSDQAHALLAGPAMCAPAHWQAEAANALWAQVARGSWAAKDAAERVATLAEAPVEPVPLAKLLDSALNLAIALHITVYDSLYVALAKARGIPLVSDDRKLLRKMRASPAFAALAQPIGDLPLP